MRPKFVVGLEGGRHTVEAEGDHAGAEPEPAVVFPDALPHQGARVLLLGSVGCPGLPTHSTGAAAA